MSACWQHTPLWILTKFLRWLCVGSTGSEPMVLPPHQVYVRSFCLTLSILSVAILCSVIVATRGQSTTCDGGPRIRRNLSCRFRLTLAHLDATTELSRQVGSPCAHRHRQLLLRATVPVASATVLPSTCGDPAEGHGSDCLCNSVAHNMR